MPNPTLIMCHIPLKKKLRTTVIKIKGAALFYSKTIDTLLPKKHLLHLYIYTFSFSSRSLVV